MVCLASKTPGAGTSARAMRPHHRTASATLLHQHAPSMSWWVARQNPACQGIRCQISVAALKDRGLRQPSHGLHGRPRAPYSSQVTC